MAGRCGYASPQSSGSRRDCRHASGRSSERTERRAENWIVTRGCTQRVKSHASSAAERLRDADVTGLWCLKPPLTITDGHHPRHAAGCRASGAVCSVPVTSVDGEEIATAHLVPHRHPNRTIAAATLTLLSHILVLPAFAAQADNKGPATTLTETMAPEHAVEFEYMNRPITMLRARVLSDSPAQRAATAEALLDKLVGDTVTGPISTRLLNGVLFITVGERDVLNLVPAD